MRMRMHILVVVALLAGVGCNADKKKSVQRTNEGVKFLRDSNWDQAIARLDEATSAYKDNHTAWYNKGLAYEGKKDYENAAAAFEQAAKLRPKDAMYQMMLGIMRYEQEMFDAKKRYKASSGSDAKIESIAESELDLKSLNFDTARAALEEAVQLNPDLYRAHHYLGRIYLYGGQEKAAAEEFTKAIEANARFFAPYIRLGEMYRLWDMPDEAIQVLKQGKQHVHNDKDRAELLFALGMAYSDKKDWKAAVDEFSAALKADKNHHRARYQRGLAHFFLKDYTNAKKDLEEASKNMKDAFVQSVTQDKLRKIMVAEQPKEPPAEPEKTN
jgi:tetratricopeptide (TPR) repeat protein